jgi:hypothetical protein
MTPTARETYNLLKINLNSLVIPQSQVAVDSSYLAYIIKKSFNVILSS